MAEREELGLPTDERKEDVEDAEEVKAASLWGLAIRVLDPTAVCTIFALFFYTILTTDAALRDTVATLAPLTTAPLVLLRILLYWFVFRATGCC